MKKPIIAISREFGSGGRMIGESVAKKLGLTVYDKTLIEMVAEKGGYSADFVEENDQRLTKSLLFQIAVTGSLPPWLAKDAGAAEGLIGKSVFSAQSEVIKDLAEKGGCVIIGRCAGHILKDDPNCLSVFIGAETEDKIDRCVKEYGFTPAAAAGEIKRRDSERAEHYNHHTGKMWGNAANYHICLNSGVFGIDGCVDLIVEAYNKLVSNK